MRDGSRIRRGSLGIAKWREVLHRVAAKPRARTVAHGFTRGTGDRVAFVSAPWRATESFLLPPEAGSQIARIEFPTGEPVGYGSYAGYADGLTPDSRAA